MGTSFAWRRRRRRLISFSSSQACHLVGAHDDVVVPVVEVVVVVALVVVVVVVVVVSSSNTALYPLGCASSQLRGSVQAPSGSNDASSVFALSSFSTLRARIRPNSGDGTKRRP